MTFKQEPSITTFAHSNRRTNLYVMDVEAHQLFSTQTQKSNMYTCMCIVFYEANQCDGCDNLAAFDISSRTVANATNFWAARLTFQS